MFQNTPHTGMPRLLLSEEKMSPANSGKSMSSAQGKQILALIRDGDYAHAGEEDAIRITLEGLAPSTTRHILDVGCGLGGTASFMAREGYGVVTGADIDQATIDYARERYRREDFYCCPADNMVSHVPPGHDLVVMFNSFYAFPDKPAALRQAYLLSAAGAELRIFDYCAKTASPQLSEFTEAYGRGRWNPVVLDQAGSMLESSGWRLESIKDLSKEYEGWYQELVKKIGEKREEIVRTSGQDWFDYALRRYEELLEKIQEGLIGGALISATRR